MNSTYSLKNVRRTVSFQLFCLVVVVSCSFSQNNHVDWSSFNMGYAKSQTSGTVVKSVAGQSFVGSSQQPGTQLMSGFLADTLFRGSVVSVSEEENVPAVFELSQNYPNPFNPSTRIHYELPKDVMVQLAVYDILGRKVTTLVNEMKRAGTYDVSFTMAGLASGIYFYRIQAGDFVLAKKMMLLK